MPRWGRGAGHGAWTAASCVVRAPAHLQPPCPDAGAGADHGRRPEDRAERGHRPLWCAASERRQPPPATLAFHGASLCKVGVPENTTPASLCAVATAGDAADLYPASSAAAIDGWLAVAAGIETAAAAWCQPTCGAATPEQRAAARQQLEAALAQLEAALASSAYLAGAAPTIADVAALSALLPLYQEVLGQDVQQQYAAITRWLQACAAQPQFAAVLGELWSGVALSCERSCVSSGCWASCMQVLPACHNYGLPNAAAVPHAMQRCPRALAACLHVLTCWHTPHRPLLPPRLASHKPGGCNVVLEHTQAVFKARACTRRRWVIRGGHISCRCFPPLISLVASSLRLPPIIVRQAIRLALHPETRPRLPPPCALAPACCVRRHAGAVPAGGGLGGAGGGRRGSRGQQEEEEEEGRGWRRRGWRVVLCAQHPGSNLCSDTKLCMCIGLWDSLLANHALCLCLLPCIRRCVPYFPAAAALPGCPAATWRALLLQQLANTHTLGVAGLRRCQPG